MDKELNDQNFFRKNHPYDSFKCTYEPDPQHLMAVTPCKYCNLPGRQDKVTVDWYNAVRRSFKEDKGLTSILAPLTREAADLVSNEGRKYGIISNTALVHVTLVDGLPSVSEDPHERKTREEQIEGIRSASRSRPGLKVLGANCIATWSNDSMLVVLKLQYASDHVVHAVQPLLEQARMPQWPFHCAVGIVEKTKADEAASNLASGLQGTVLSLQAESIRELGAHRVDSDGNSTQHQHTQLTAVVSTLAGRWEAPYRPDTWYRMWKPENGREALASQCEADSDGTTNTSSQQQTSATTQSTLASRSDVPPWPKTLLPLVQRDGASRETFLREQELKTSVDISSDMANGLTAQQQPPQVLQQQRRTSRWGPPLRPETLLGKQKNGREGVAAQFEHHSESVSTIICSQQQTRAISLSTDTGQPDAQPSLETLPPLMMSSDEGERRSPWRQVAVMDQHLGRTDPSFVPEPELTSSMDTA
jgi:hypothetical protein